MKDRMVLIVFFVSGMLGVITAAFVHLITWYLRVHLLTWIMIAGAGAALLVTAFLFVLSTSDVGYLTNGVLIIIWMLALVFGSFQALSIPTAWWKGVLAVLFEEVLAVLIVAAITLSSPTYIYWLQERLPWVSDTVFTTTFVLGFIMTLLVLAFIRPVLRYLQAPAGPASVH